MLRQSGQRIAAGAGRIKIATGKIVGFGVRQLAIGRYDRDVFGQEGSRYADRAGQHAARIIAQVEHKAFHIGLLGVERGNFFGQIFDGRLLKLRDAHPTVARFDDLAFDALYPDFLARDGNEQRLIFILTGDREDDFGIRFAAHALDSLVKGHALDRGAVEAGDQVACFEAGFVGGGIFDRRDDFDVTVFHAHFNTETDKFALGAFTQLFEGFFIQISRMRIQRRHHAGDCFGQQFFVFNDFDIIGFD